MARRPLVAGSAAGLSVWLTVASVALALVGVVAGDEASSVAWRETHVIPEFVTKYAPLVWLHSQDPFRPADLLQHIRHTTPMAGSEPVDIVTELDLDNLALLNEVSEERVALTSKDNVTSLPDWLLGETPDSTGKLANATACVVILVDKGPLDIDAFYFYFYSYDRGPNITQVMEPLNGIFGKDVPGYSFGDHVGDWEHNMVRFHNGKPTGIYYSQHRDGAAYNWDDQAISKTDDRPVVYSAYGSHANYPSEGGNVHDIVLIDYCDAGQIWDPVMSAYFYHLEPATFHLTRLLPSASNESVGANQTSFFYYTGIWGDVQYPDDNPIQKTVPHFGLKRFVSGPTGPRAKRLLRKGLLPDHPRRRTWMEWAVGIFMAWYPCCIRGPRKWVSVFVIVACLVLVVVSIRYAMRRRRLRQYTRVETEIPMEDLGRMENAR